MIPQNSDLLTIKATAARLGLNEQTVYRWIKHGWLESLPLGPRNIRISAEIVDQIIKYGLSVKPSGNFQTIGKPRIKSCPRPKGGKAWR